MEGNTWELENIKYRSLFVAGTVMRIFIHLTLLMFVMALENKVLRSHFTHWEDEDMSNWVTCSRLIQLPCIRA